MSKELILEEGKYTYIQHESGKAEGLRYGEHWRDLTGDKFIGAMADRIEELERERDAFYMDYRMKCDEEAKGSALVIIERDRLRANINMLRDAFQTFIDEHEECQDADEWMAELCSIEALHVAGEALAASRDAEIAEMQRNLANEQARDIHSCHPDCTREGCVNRRLRAELVKALAACKAKDEALRAANHSCIEDWPLLREALAIQPDDAALKAWLGAPVWVYSKDFKLVNEYGFNKIMVDDKKRGMADTPLYSPKELK